MAFPDYRDVPELKHPLRFRIKMFFLRMQQKIRFAIGKRRKPKETRMELHNGLKVDICPRCGQLVYCETQCVYCGQRFLPGATTIGETLQRKEEKHG